MRLLFSFFIIVTFGYYSVAAQEPHTITTQSTEQDVNDAKELIKKPLNGFGGISFAIGNPQKGSFQQSIGNNSFGFSLHGGYFFDPVPITVGAEVDFLFFGGDKKYLPRTVLGVGVKDTLETSTTMIPILLTTRFQHKIGHYVIPYIELSGGANFYSSSTELKTYPANKISNSESSVLWMYGLGIGTQIRLVDFVELPSEHSALFFDIRFRYLFGNEQTLQKASINENNEAKFTSFTAVTDMLTTHIGITWMF